MPTLQQLRDQRANTWAQAQDFNERAERGEDMSAEDDAAWTRAMDEIDSLGEEIERRERTADLGKRFADIDEQTRDGIDPATGQPATRTGVPDDDTAGEAYRAAFTRFMRMGMGELAVEERQMLRAHFDAELRALGVTSGAAGGYTVPEGFWAKVTETQKYFGGAANGAEVINTGTGNPLPWATNDDTSNEGYYLGENVETTNEGDPSFGQKRLDAHTAVSGPVKSSLILIQDSAFDIEGFVARNMGERIARRSNRAFTTGTGVGQPAGYIPNLTVGVTTASATAITYDELIDLIHSVDAAYRATGRCKWKLHDLVLAKLRKLRDDSGGAGVGRPIWEPSVQAGVPDLLLGYGYDVNNDQDSAVTATKKTLAFGDWASAFVIRRVAGGQMMRLEERYAEFLQVAFIGFERHDSVVQDSSAAKVLQQHA